MHRHGNSSANPKKSRPQTGRATAIWVITIGALALAGLVLSHLAQTLVTYRWVRTPCKVLSSRITDYDDGTGRRSYTLDVRFEYTSRGRTFQSTVYNDLHGFMQAKQNWTDYSEATRALERFPAGSSTVCFVHPEDPSRAALTRGDIWAHVLMLVMTAMLWGLLMVFYVPGKARGLDKTAPALSSPSGPHPRLKEARQSALVALLTVPMGLALAWWSLGKPWAESRAARDWVETPCTIVSSDLRTFETRSGPDYSPNILFAYQFGGREYRANKFQFNDETESKAAAVQRILAKYPAGSKANCYVNPADPTVAVLNREFTLSLSLTVIVPVFMVGAGLVCLGIAVALWLGFRVPAWLMGQTVSERANSPEPPHTGSLTLHAETASPGRMLLAGLGALVCFGFFAYVIRDHVRDWRQTGQFEFSAIALIYTGLSGLFGVVALVEWWKFFNPHPTLRLSRGAVPLGESFDLNWSISGNLARLRDLTLNLEAREEIVREDEEMTAIGRQKKITTQKRVFYSQSLALPGGSRAPREGIAHVDVPAGLMPSFDGQRSKIIWSIAVRAGVRFGCKLEDDFKFRVLPPAA